MKKRLAGIFLSYYSLLFTATTVFGVVSYPIGNEGIDSIHYSPQKEVIYLGDKSYVFSRPVSVLWLPGMKGDVIGTLKFDTKKENGRLLYNKKECKTLHQVLDPNMNEKDKGIDGTRLAACLYRNKIYVFYDSYSK